MPDSTFFIDILILLVAAVVAVPLFLRLRLGPVLGYLTAGIIIGPYGFSLIGSLDDITHVAELGVVFLLFAIGLELKLARLWVMRRFVFGLGSAQVVVTGFVIALAAWLLGLSPEAAIITGGALALSSTAVVLQILIDRGELTTRPGRAAFSILLMQDLAVVPLLAFVNVMAGEGPSVPSAVILAAVQAAAVVLVILLVGRFLLRPVLRAIAGSYSSDVFAAAAVLVVLGTAWLTAQVGLSMALGAFLAGLMLAETEFRHQIEADIQPFRGFLLGLFFMTVGMSVDLRLILGQPLLIAAVVAALLLIKLLAAFVLARLFRLPAGASLHVGLILAQGGEFAFVLFGMAVTGGIFPNDVAQILILAVSLTMMVTPILAIAASRLAESLSDAGAALPSLGEIGEMRNHVIIAGFGRVGQTVASMLAEQAIPYVALDLHADRVADAHSRGLQVFFADASRPDVLRLAGAAHAQALVLTLDHAARAEHTVLMLRAAFPRLRVFARARDRAHSSILREAGAAAAVPETLEASLQLGATVLRAAGTPADVIETMLGGLRSDDYSRLGALVSGRSNDDDGLEPKRSRL